MKTIRLVSFSIPIFGGLLSAQSPVEPPLATVRVLAEIAVDPSEIRFVPPPPPKPAPPMETRSAVIHHLTDRTVTIVRAEASTFPDVPEPAIDRDNPTPALPEAFRKSFVLPFSVVVYDRRISRITWSDPQSKDEFEAWCDWDWSLVAPMHTIESSDVDYSILVAPFHVSTTTAKQGAFPHAEIPDHPLIPPGGFVLTKGSPGGNAGKPVIQSVQGFLERNKAKLEALRDARDLYRKDAAAWRKANPPKPENHTIWLKPHRGSRYLGKSGVATAPTIQIEEDER